MFYIVLFFSIYWVSLPIFMNSLFLLAGALILINPYYYIQKLPRIAVNKIIFAFIISIFILLISSLLVANFSVTKDYSYASLIVRQIPYIFSAIVIGSYFAMPKNEIRLRESIEAKLLTVGAVQGIIVAAAITFPDFRTLILPFQGAQDTDFLLNEHNFGVRGFALSSQQFFGLSAMLCVQCGIIVSWLLENKNNVNMYSLIKFAIFGIACFFVGRVSGITFILLFSYMIFVSNYVIKIKLFIFVVVLFFLIYNINFDIYTFNWAFEVFISLIEGRGIESASLSQLFNEMIFMPSLEQVMFGDGIYTSPSGGYYLGTDSGYLRPILFSGIFTLCLLVFPYYLVAYYSLSSNRYEKYKTPSVALSIILIFIIQVKGEVFITGTMTNVLLFLYLTYYYLRSKNVHTPT